MKILFITDNFPPEVNAPAARTYEHCSEWVRQGHDVTVITCAPNFPQGVLYEGYKNRICSSENVDGIKVIRVWSYITANVGFIKRVLDYISFSFMAFWLGLFQNTDVIVATSPQFFTTFTACALSKIKRRPWVFELRDLWPESIITVGAMEKGLAIRMLERAEQFMYRDADLIIPVTNAFRDRLISYGVPADKLVVVTNGVDPKRFSPQPKNNLLAENLGLANKTIIGYVGTHGLAHNLEHIVKTMQACGDANVHALFIGDGAQKEKIVKLAVELGLENVTFLDPVPKASVANYLSIMDAVLVPLRKSDTFKTVIPSKIFEAAAMQKPILLGVDGQAREIVESYGAGIFFEPDDSASLLQAIDRLKSDKNLQQQIRTGGSKLAKAYDRNRLANNMLSAITCLNEQRRQ